MNSDVRSAIALAAKSAGGAVKILAVFDEVVMEVGDDSLDEVLGAVTKKLAEAKYWVDDARRRLQGRKRP